MGGEGGRQFLSLREAYLSNLSLLRSLEPLEKFVVVVGGWWCLNVKLVIGFGPSLGLGLELRAKPINSFQKSLKEFEIWKWISVCKL